MNITHTERMLQLCSERGEELDHLGLGTALGCDVIEAEKQDERAQGMDAQLAEMREGCVQVVGLAHVAAYLGDDGELRELIEAALSATTIETVRAALTHLDHGTDSNAADFAVAVTLDVLLRGAVGLNEMQDGGAGMPGPVGGVEAWGALYFFTRYVCAILYDLDNKPALKARLGDVVGRSDEIRRNAFWRIAGDTTARQTTTGREIIKNAARYVLPGLPGGARIH